MEKVSYETQSQHQENMMNIVSNNICNMRNNICVLIVFVHYRNDFGGLSASEWQCNQINDT